MGDEERVPADLQCRDWPGGRDVIERCLRAKKPIITSSPFIHNIRHPIVDPLMAEATTAGGMLEIHEELLRSKDLRLMQHFLRRTDLSPPEVLPPQGAFGCTADSPLPGWHVDGGFCPNQYTATPKQIFCAPALSLAFPTGPLFRCPPCKQHFRSSLAL